MSGPGREAATPATLLERAGRSGAPAADPGPEVGEAEGAAGSRYVLEREIAEGGMGRVFAGRDLRLGRPVAIKVLRASDAGLSRRFEREALVAARLQHPGIVTVYDAGFWPTGEPFLVMRLVLGRSLDRVIAEAEALDERLALLPHVIAAADALAYAHDQGIVHRDLKPSNVVVGAFGETVVLDWGLAKDLRGSAGDDVGAPTASWPTAAGGLTTGAGVVMGTPAYMPPEQAAGEPVDTRADVYALGAILYQVVAGQAPQPRAGRTAGGGGGPSGFRPSAPLAEAERAAPADLCAIVAQAMALDRAARYPSAFELAEDLKRFQAGQLVSARRYSVAARAARWSRRHPIAAAIGLVVLGALMARGCGY